MSEDQKSIKANEVFNGICTALDEMNIRYVKKTDDVLGVDFGVPSHDIPIRIVITLDIENEHIMLFSCLPINIPTDKYFEMSVAVNAANCTIVNGSFDFDCNNGSLFFKMTNSYKNSVLGTELYKYMVNVAMETVDSYNDEFLKIARDLITLREFLNQQNF